MAEAIAENGYAQTAVADVTARAGVSRRTFYEQFTGKEDCFLAAFDAGAEVLFETVQAAIDPQEAAERQMRAALETYLTLLAAEPAFAKATLVEVFAAGPGAVARRQRLFDRFVALFEQIIRGADASLASHPGKPTASAGKHAMAAGEHAEPGDIELATGAIGYAVTMRVASGQAALLPGLCDRFTRFMLAALRPEDGKKRQRKG
jgi:AcrR family transcriptional regulator